MIDPRFLPQLKKVNDLPFNQHCLEQLKKLKFPWDSQELHCLELLNWALEHHKLDVDEQTAESIPLMWGLSPNRVSYLLRLEVLSPPKFNPRSPEETAQELADEWRDRVVLDIIPEEEEEEMEEQVGVGDQSGGSGIDDIINSLLEFSKQEAERLSAKDAQQPVPQ
jgi:hypothetical protein